MKTLRAAIVAVALVAVAACDPLPVGNGPQTPGIWINGAELAQLPTSGAAWDSMREAADSRWGTPTIADQNSKDDTDTLAGALVAARLDDEGRRNKVRAHLMELVRSHPYSNVLALARQLPSYVIAADVVGLDRHQRAAFVGFLHEAMNHKMRGHSGGDDLRTTALRSPNNWGTMSRAAMAAALAYVGDRDGLLEVANAQAAWLGWDRPNQLKYTSTDWHARTPAGVVRSDVVRDGHPLGGVLPEDQRRTGDYRWPAPAGSYPHEALQGAVVASVILDRTGMLPFDAGDHALARAETWLRTVNANPASGDDRNTAWLLDRYSKRKVPTASGTSPAKNIAWADWTAA